jgi:cellobiose phosphorylase
MCSPWTVTLHHQTLAALALALERSGRAAAASALTASREAIRADFQRFLMPDGIVSGLSYFAEDGSIVHWLHPRDREHGVRYRLLPMVHAIIADLFTQEQAARHIEVIRSHLLASDGARLFDRPFSYRGGLQRTFQRAESSSFFGREIGLMYTHAHLRYAEAMARYGDAEAFFAALQQANPVGLREVVRNSRVRQVNCYTSSSDAAFMDRADASARYDAVRTGAVEMEGGWRVYSSGAGIALRLIRECLLGLRMRRSSLGIDPVLPRALDGLRARAELLGRAFELRYRVGARGCGPTALVLNGTALAFDREPNPYREGGAVVSTAALRERLREGDNELAIEIG